MSRSRRSFPARCSVIEACREKGFLVQMGHSDATFEQAEEGKRAGATGITHLFNAMRGFHHREPGLAGFGLMDDEIFVEIIADMAHLHPQSLKMLFDMKPPDRIMLVSDSVKGPGWGSGPMRGAGGVLMGSGICSCRCGQEPGLARRSSGAGAAVRLGQSKEISGDDDCMIRANT